jgi:hypothetical protein
MLHLPKPAISIVLISMLIGSSTACSHRPSDESIAKDIQSKAAADPDTKDSQVSVTAKSASQDALGTPSS